MRKKWIFLFLVILAYGLLLTGAVLAAPNADEISWYVISGGGGHIETANSAITLESTIGQPVEGIASANLCSGFWCGFDWLSAIKIFLPLIMR